VKRIKCVKKPIIVEAIEIDDEFIKSMPMHIGKWYVSKVADDKVRVPTLEGELIANKGDFIIIGVEGEIYPIRRDVFQKTYDIIPTALKINDYELSEVGEKILKEYKKCKFVCTNDDISIIFKR
jgi:hypothetical protein